jgi:site-specific recombinase
VDLALVDPKRKQAIICDVFEFFRVDYVEKTKEHLFSELLYAAEILSIWIASEEFDENFIRLDKRLLNRDSAFIALQRNISDFIYKIQKANKDTHSLEMDVQHIYVLIEQCNEQVHTFKKKSVDYGISIDLVYQLERLTQIIERLEVVLALIKHFGKHESNIELIQLFKESVIKNDTKNSLSEIYQQSIHIVAKSIANNTSAHGEHYIASNTKEYIAMFLSTSGAGILIAMMALLKINIIQVEFSQGIETLLSSLNYGLGFVIIHLSNHTKLIS